MKREVAFKIQREAMGLTQKDIAEWAGVSLGTVSNYENGKDVRDIYVKQLEDTLRSTKDRIYPQHSRERSEFSVRFYERMWEESETENDKRRFLNKLLMSIAYIQEDDIYKDRNKYSTVPGRYSGPYQFGE